jgi:hypothetical protein
MSNSNIPTAGSVIRFSRLPAGSYCSIGVLYRISIEGPYVYTQNIKTGSGSSDNTWAYRNAAFETV